MIGVNESHVNLFPCIPTSSYCTNYYGDAAPADAGAGVCDWCLSDDPLVKNRRPSAPPAMQHRGPPTGMGCGKVKVTGGGEQEGGRRVAKAAVRRYKLLKDVLC